MASGCGWKQWFGEVGGSEDKAPAEDTHPGGLVLSPLCPWLRLRGAVFLGFTRIYEQSGVEGRPSAGSWGWEAPSKALVAVMGMDAPANASPCRNSAQLVRAYGTAAPRQTKFKLIYFF